MFYALCFSALLAVSAYVEAFNEIVSGPVAQYLSLSQKIGGDVKKHVSNSSDVNGIKYSCLLQPLHVISDDFTKEYHVFV